MPALDTLAARAVYAARLLERAIHSPGPWKISWGPFTVDAVRAIHDDRVVFSAEFPDACFIEQPASTATLLDAGEVVSVREVAFPGDGAFSMDWVVAPDVLIHA